MWTYLLGPLLALFPKPWRDLLPFSRKVEWERATTISGMAELALGLVALGYWYMNAMGSWVGNGTSAALSAKLPEVRPQDIGGVALVVWLMHPLTWLVAYVCFEGSFRLCVGAFGDAACGTFPLYLGDKIIFSPFRSGKRGGADASGGMRGNISSYVGAIRERVQVATIPECSDEVCFEKHGPVEIMEIRTSRRKQDWNPPRIVRYLDAYYRLEEGLSGFGSHPFRYRLRRLAAGVPGRNVLIYSPVNPVIRESSLR